MIRRSENIPARIPEPAESGISQHITVEGSAIRRPSLALVPADEPFFRPCPFAQKHKYDVYLFAHIRIQ